jgi:PAS domain S-box-containing protein
MEKTLTVNLSMSEYINLHYFEALLADSVVSKTDTEGNITYINANFTKVTGYTKEEVLGKNHNILRHPANEAKIYKKLWTTLKQGKVWRDRLLNKNKDGSDFWAECTIIPLIDKENAQVVEYIAIRRDITDFLITQRKLQDEKYKSQEQQKVTQAKDSFLVLFSHELKTPLNAIINFSKYLLKHEGKLDALPQGKVKNLLERIDAAAIQMLEHVTQILELSRLKANKLTYRISTFNTFESLQQVVEDHRPLAHTENVEITCENLCELQKRENKFLLESDEFRFGQIFANILSNAIKYGKSRVHLSLRVTPSLWELHVEDDGPGIVNKEGVFDLFEQEGALMNKDSKSGTGVGLAFVKYLCQDLGFTYELGTSERFGGLEFCLKKELKGDA